MSRNYLTCPRCGWSSRIWGRRLDAVIAQARRADHFGFHHSQSAAAAAAPLRQPAAIAQEKDMSHSVVTHVKHSEHVGHDDANGVAAITAKYIADLEAAGHTVHHHHVHRHADAHHHSHTHG